MLNNGVESAEIRKMINFVYFVLVSVATYMIHLLSTYYAYVFDG